MPDCTCHPVGVGLGKPQGLDWQPDCREHGLESDWWNSKEQIDRRAADRLYLLDLQRRAREARKKNNNG